MTGPSIQHEGRKHDLDHLAPFQFEAVQEATNDRPERRTAIAVSFGWHCYTRSPEENEQGRVLKDKRGDLRVFCLGRYELSRQLPDIIEQLSTRKISQTGKGNYVTIEIIDHEGDKRDYEIYFTLRQPQKKQPLKLFVESAYIRDDRAEGNRQKAHHQAIRFAILVYKVKNGKNIPYKR